MTKFFGFCLSFLLLTSVFVVACKFDRDEDGLADIEAMSSDATDTEIVMQDVEADIDNDIQAFEANEECPEVTSEQPLGTYPNVVTIDYGTDGCEGPNGHIRKGKIVVYMSAELMISGAEREITFVDYSVDDIAVTGTKTITNTGLNGSGQPTFSRTVANGSLTWPDGTSTTWESSTTATMTEGAGDMVWANNVWSVEGTASGVGKNGNAWTSTITTPLVRKATCPWPTEGVRTIVLTAGTATLDYGFGSTPNGCDRKAELTGPNGNTGIVNIRF
jgi:hypothetical protein